MIDDKKIEEAANLHRFELIASMHGSTLGTPMQCSEEVVDAEIDLIENSFIAGAKCGINELLNGLWHPVSEKPKKSRGFLYKTVFNGQGLKQIVIRNEWKQIIKYQKATQWRYIDDLLPKKGGGEH